MDELKTEHELLKNHLNKMEVSLNHKQLDIAKENFLEFTKLIKRHIDKEDTLFPALESRLGLNPEDSPFVVFKLEHEQILVLIDQLEALLTSDDLSSIFDKSDELINSVCRHCQREETIVYTIES